VARMEEVEAAVREDDACSGRTAGGEGRRERREVGGELRLGHGGPRIAHARGPRKRREGRSLTPRGGSSYTPPHDGELPAPSLAGEHDGPGRPERAPRRGGGGRRARRRGAGGARA